jgi:hypothetical protein
MPDEKRIAVFCEGDDDRAVLVRLHAAELLPARLDIVKRVTARHGGTEGMLDEWAAGHAPAGMSAVLVRDLDVLEAGQELDWLQRGVSARGFVVMATVPAGEGPPARRLDVARGEPVGTAPHSRVTVVAAGLPDAAEIRDRFGLRSFALDDYVLRLVLDQRIYEQVTEVRTVPHAKALVKLDSFRDEMKANGLEITQAKRLLQLLRGITGFRASSATFADRFVEKAVVALGAEATAEVFQPLLRDLHAAAELIVSE